MKWALLIVTATCARAADPPRIFYSKTFKGSTPEYMQITLDKAGRVEYREAPDDNDPLISKLGEAEVTEIFGLAEKLDWFRKPLESGLKVARMGDKTYRMENFESKGEVTFNYSTDETARVLQDWFEKLAESAMHRINLERSARFDKLGVNKVLLQLESAYDRKRLASLDQ